MTNARRELFLKVLDKVAAKGARFHTLQGGSWGRRLKRVIALNYRLVSYLFSRFVTAHPTARMFWGRRFLWGPPEHSTTMYLYGLLEHPEEVRLTRFLIRTLADDDVFFDIGANFGFYSLLAAEFVKSGRICSFEPVPYVFKNLQKNSRSAPNIEAVNCAVSNRVGTIDFDQAPESRHTGSSIDEKGSRVPGAPLVAFTKIRVSTTTIDEFSARGGLVPTIMKIDVEGAEKLVIEGARATLSSGSPTVILEVLKPPTDNRGHRDAVRMLQELGYRPHALTAPGGLRELDAAALEAELSSGEAANLVFRQIRSK